MTDNPNPQDPARTPAQTPAALAAPARPRWTQRTAERLQGTRGVIAVGVAGLLLGGFGGAAIAATVGDDDGGHGRDGRNGRDGFGRHDRPGRDDQRGPGDGDRAPDGGLAPDAPPTPPGTAGDET